MKDLCNKTILCQSCPFKLLYHNPRTKTMPSCYKGKYRHTKHTIPDWTKVLEVTQ